MKNTIIIFVIALLLCSCRSDEVITLKTDILVGMPEFTGIKGFYLLNEGNMGTNKSTLDYYNYEKGVYSRNIFAAINPTVPKELGDVGNDIKIYGNRLYIVIGCSNKVEVMEAATAKRIGQIEVPNCRYICFHEGYAYVTSYAGPVEASADYKQLGYVAKIDTATLKEVNRCLVGYQPDEPEIVRDKIYVANSGGYMSPNYDNTVSVIDIHLFTEVKKIEVAINPHRIRSDGHGNLWISSRGNSADVPSRLYCIDSTTDTLTDTIDVKVSNFCIVGDSIYLFNAGWNPVTKDDEVSYGIVDIVKKELVSTRFITDGTEKKIKIPYGIMVNPITKDIYVTDANNYVSPGMLYCFDKYGKKKWNVQTGDIPACFVLVGK